MKKKKEEAKSQKEIQWGNGNEAKKSKIKDFQLLWRIWVRGGAESEDDVNQGFLNLTLVIKS